MKTLVRGTLVMLAGVGLLAVAGCGSTPSSTAAKDKVTQKDKKDKGKEDDRATWWCADHGIPEHECSLCSDAVAKECKAKGDWCKEHERAESQCFFCKPARREVYAAKFRTRYDGDNPPPIPEFDKDKKGK